MGLVTNVQNDHHEGLLTQQPRYYLRILNCKPRWFNYCSRKQRKKIVPYNETEFLFGRCCSLDFK